LKKKKEESAQHSVHPTGGSLRVFKLFAWLEVGSVKMALSRPTHQRVTHTVGLLRSKMKKMKSINAILFAGILLAGCGPTIATFSPAATQTKTLLPTPPETITPLIPKPLKLPPTGSALYTFDRLHGELVQFGGVNAYECAECNNTWVWDGTTWSQRQPQNSPPGRFGAGFVYDEARQNSVLFGSPSQLPELINDTWVWDGQAWIEKHPALSPSPRGGVNMVYDSNHKQVILFGGEARDPNNSRGTIAFNETWIWDGYTWTRAYPKDSPPAPLGIPWTMAYDKAHRYIVLYEGLATWTWNGSNWTEQHPVHSPENPFYGVMGYDEIDQQLVFVGQTLYNVPQTWVWDGMDWIQIQTQLQLDLGSQPHLFFDTKAQALLLYVVNRNKAGVTGSSLWMWKTNNWTRIY
jgi:hypothetical protein